MEEDGAAEEEVASGVVGEGFEAALGGEGGTAGAGKTCGKSCIIWRRRARSLHGWNLWSSNFLLRCVGSFCRYPPCLWYLRAVAPK